MKYRYKIGAALFALLLLVLSLPVLPAAAEDGTESLPLDKAKAYYIGTADGNTVLKSTDTKAVLPPSSTVKMMSGYVLCEYFANRQEETVTVTGDMVRNVTGRYVGMKSGATPTVKDLLYMGFCGGFNDAILILAHTAYGSEAGLVEAMNAKAAALGMKNTLYANATGLDDATAFTTLSDLVRLAVAAYASPLYMTITTTADYATTGLYSPFSFSNYNSLVSAGSYRNSICKGMNAGNTPETGYAVVTVAEKKGAAYLCIVLGAQKDTETVYSYLIANKLIAWALNRYGTKSLIDTSHVVCEIPVTLSVKTDTIAVVPADGISAFVPLDYTLGKEVTYDYELYKESLRAPVEAGTHVGKLTLYCNGSALGTVELVTKTGAENSRILEGIDKISAFTKSDFFAGALITALVCIVLWIVISAIWKGSRKKRASR